MLGKLIKYDLRYSARSLLTMFAVFIGLAILLLGMNVMDFDISSEGIIALLTVPLCIALCVMYFVSTVSLYKKSLFGDEGYLTLTLPASSKVLLLSKLLSSFIWGIACVLIFLIYALIVSTMFIGLSDVFHAVSQAIGNADATSIMTLLCLLIFSCFELLSTIMFSSCVTAIPALRVRNMGVPAGIISFFLVTVLSGRITDAISNALPTYSGNWLNSPVLWIEIAVSIVVSLGLYFASAYLLDRHKTL